jgi:hypothetical protein
MMNIRRALFVIVAPIAVSVLLASAQSSNLLAETPAGDAGERSARNITVPENVLNPLAGEAEHRFDQAASLFASGDVRGAASEIRAGAAFLRLETGRQHAANQAALESSADELEHLAGKVEHGEVSSRRELELAFGRADLALAEHYRAMAREAIANHQHDEAGRWLKAAADAVDDATRWTGRKPATVQAQARDQVHALEAKIRSGANWTYDEGKKGVGYLGTQIEYLGSQMQKVGTSPKTSQ